MPDTPRHRGAAPEDEQEFAPSALGDLRLATQDLCWLLDRGYALASSAELVGNRYSLGRRQRMAVGRCACSDDAWQRRRGHQVEPAQLADQELWLDGYNVLTIVESALAGGVILLGCDGCHRDLANLHARYRKVEETIPALQLVGELTTAWAVRKCLWWLDRPVSNSGRLQRAIVEVAASAGWNWQVELVFNPDKVLAQSSETVATSDSAILDRCERWLNLARLTIAARIPQARVVDLCIQRPASTENEDAGRQAASKAEDSGPPASCRR